MEIPELYYYPSKTGNIHTICGEDVMEEQKWIAWMDEQRTRLQKEIDSFLQRYDPNNQEHILLLFAYRRIIDSFRDRTKRFFKNSRECIESLVKKLTSEHLAWCATLCDFDVYLNRVIEDCEKWEMYEITLMELVDSAVRFMVLQDGFAELSCYVGDDVLSMEEFFAQDEKQFALSDGFRYLVRNECDRRYDFDSRFDDDVEDV